MKNKLKFDYLIFTVIHKKHEVWICDYFRNIFDILFKVRKSNNDELPCLQNEKLRHIYLWFPEDTLNPRFRILFRRCLAFFIKKNYTSKKIRLEVNKL